MSVFLKWREGSKTESPESMQHSTSSPYGSTMSLVRALNGRNDRGMRQLDQLALDRTGATGRGGGTSRNSRGILPEEEPLEMAELPTEETGASSNAAQTSSNFPN